MSDGAPSLYEKLEAVRRAVGVVHLQAGSDDGGFEYAAAEDVFAKVRPKLLKHKVGVFPEVGNVVRDGKRTRVELRVRLVNLEVAGDELVQAWAGEAEGGIAGASTNGLKTFYLATFQIRTEGIESAMKKAPKRTRPPLDLGDDPDRMTEIQAAARGWGLTDDELGDVLAQMFGHRNLEMVRWDRGYKVAWRLRFAGEQKKAGNPHTITPVTTVDADGQAKAA